jgi:hypothetical protein
MVDSHCHRRALVDSLARPGGNATGFLFGDYSLSEKWPPYIKNPQMTMVIDRDHGVSVDQVRQELYNCFGARQVSTIYTAVERLLRDPGVRSAGQADAGGAFAPRLSNLEPCPRMDVAGGTGEGPQGEAGDDLDPDADASCAPASAGFLGRRGDVVDYAAAAVAAEQAHLGADGPSDENGAHELVCLDGVEGGAEDAAIEDLVGIGGIFGTRGNGAGRGHGAARGRWRRDAVLAQLTEVGVPEVLKGLINGGECGSHGSPEVPNVAAEDGGVTAQAESDANAAFAADNDIHVDGNSDKEDAELLLKGRGARFGHG